MANVALVTSFIAEIASFIAFVQLVIAAFEDEVWKGIVGFIAWPYLGYWAIVEYYDEAKWPRIATWLGGHAVAIVLLIAYFYLALPPGNGTR